jgi:hypothetical protein
MALEVELLVASLKSIQEQLDHVEKATQRLAASGGVKMHQNRRDKNV